MLYLIEARSVCIVSILRVHSLYVLARNEQDAMFYSAPPIYWAAIEMNLAIVCACVPALKPLFTHIVPAFASRLSGNGSTQRSGFSKTSKFARSFQRLDGKGRSSIVESTDTERGFGGTELDTITALPPLHRHTSSMGRIRVTHDLEQRSSPRPSGNPFQRAVMSGLR